MLNVERANVEFTRRLGWNFDLLHVIKLQSLTRAAQFRRRVNGRVIKTRGGNTAS